MFKQGGTNKNSLKKVRDAFKRLHRGTVKWVEDEGDEEMAEAVIAASRKNYAKRYVAKKHKKANFVSGKDSVQDQQEDNTNSDGEQALSESERAG